ncbi:MAG: DUF2167 domain-containing protein [Bacteroidota bacterium]
MKNLTLLSLFVLFSLSLFAEEPDTTTVQEVELSEEELTLLYEAYIDSIEQSLNYEDGVISLRDDIATLQVPDGYKYLNGEDSEMILTDLWGNPPSEPEDRSMGMLIPKENSINDDSSFVINITYSEEGYIDDSDAKDIDYDELLESMQSDALASNEMREAQGYPTIELMGWASPPFYDAENKKLHWAKELRFGGSDDHTLNYNIRILGRKGYLELNVIGQMHVVEEVKSKINPILASANFNDGHKYSDFNPNIDKVAAYGIGGLIAGKVLAKAGIFAKIGIVLAKFWKIIALGAIGLFAAFRRMIGGKSEDEVPTA